MQNRKKHLLAFLLVWHKRFGVGLAILVILWAATGVLHPIMSWLNPKPIHKQASFVIANSQTPLLTLQNALQKHAIEDIEWARLIAFNQQPYYQIKQAQQTQALYIHAQTGATLQDGDARYAVLLAQYYTGKQAHQTPPQQQTQFDGDYPRNNQYLPVYKIDLEREGGLRAYIDPHTSTLAALMDDHKALMSQIFTGIHKWGWLPHGPITTWLASIALAMIALLALAGAVLYALLWKKLGLQKHPSVSRTWHRRLGLITLSSTLVFCVSGIWHLWAPTPALLSPQNSQPNVLNQAQLEGVPPIGVRVRAIAGQACLMQVPTPATQMESHHAHEHAAHAMPNQAVIWQALDGQHPCNGTQHAQTLGALATGLANPSVELQTHFNHDYGFFNKRLPVYKVAYPTNNQLTLYIDPITDTTVRAAHNPARLEGWVFAYLHKWSWLDDLGLPRIGRDSILMLFASLNIIVVGLGFASWLKRRRLRTMPKIGLKSDPPVCK